MEYSITSWPIQKLYDLIKANKINLRPSYQRNFVWGEERSTIIDRLNTKRMASSDFLFIQIRKRNIRNG